MNTEDTQALIVEYLNGELQGQARLDFEAALKTNATLAEELELARQLQNHFQDEDFATFQQDLQEVMASKPKPVRKIPTWRILAAAASILLLFGIGWWWMSKGPINTETLFAQNFTSYEAPVSKSPTILNPEIELEKGTTLLQQGQTEQALQQFDQVLQVENLFVNTVLLTKWYKVLTFLKMKDLESCRRELNEIVEHPDCPVVLLKKASTLLVGLKGLNE